MSRRVIDRSEWPAFADAFSRRYEGWLISISIESGEGRRRYLTRDLPLRGVVVETGRDASSLMIFTGHTTPHATHFVDRAVSLEIDETAEGADAALTIADDKGARTVVEFRSPMPPELVDGIAP